MYPERHRCTRASRNPVLCELANERDMYEDIGTAFCVQKHLFSAFHERNAAFDNTAAKAAASQHFKELAHHTFSMSLWLVSPISLQFHYLSPQHSIKKFQWLCLNVLNCVPIFSHVNFLFILKLLSNQHNLLIWVFKFQLIGLHIKQQLHILSNPGSLFQLKEHSQLIILN